MSWEGGWSWEGTSQPHGWCKDYKPSWLPGQGTTIPSQQGSRARGCCPPERDTSWLPWEEKTQQLTLNTGARGRRPERFMFCFGIKWTCFLTTVWIQLLKLKSQWFSSPFVHPRLTSRSQTSQDITVVENARRGGVCEGPSVIWPFTLHRWESGTTQWRKWLSCWHKAPVSRWRRTRPWWKNKEKPTGWKRRNSNYRDVSIRTHDHWISTLDSGPVISSQKWDVPVRWVTESFSRPG